MPGKSRAKALRRTAVRNPPRDRVGIRFRNSPGFGHWQGLSSTCTVVMVSSAAFVGGSWRLHSVVTEADQTAAEARKQSLSQWRLWAARGGIRWRHPGSLVAHSWTKEEQQVVKDGEGACQPCAGPQIVAFAGVG